MAINSKRRAIQHMVYGALPPHSTNVLWMDTSVPELPVCKIFWNGCWTSVHTDDSKEIALLVKVVEELSSTTESQENTIAELSDQILAAIQAIDLSEVAKEDNATANKEAILTAVSNLQTALQGEDTTATITALKELTEAVKDEQLDWNSFAQSVGDRGLLKLVYWPVDGTHSNEYAIAAGEQVSISGTTYCIARLYATSTNAGTHATDGYRAIAMTSGIGGLSWGEDSDVYEYNPETKEIGSYKGEVSTVAAFRAASSSDVDTAKTAIIAALPSVASIQNGLAKDASVKDGNDTAISIGKEVRSEVGTGSDTASESGTLFAVVKWIKDKVKSIYGSITDNTSGLVAIKNAIEDNAGIPMVTVPNTTASQELTPNVVYVFSTRSSALTLTLGAGEVGQVNDYHFFIVTDTTAPTITWPAGITWNGGNAPTIAGDKTYEIDILNNVAVYLEI